MELHRAADTPEPDLGYFVASTNRALSGCYKNALCKFTGVTQLGLQGTRLRWSRRAWCAWEPEVTRGQSPILRADLACEAAICPASSRSQLGILVVVTGRLAARLPVPLLLHGQIPHKPGMATVFDQYCRLLRAGKQPIPAHTNNLGTTTDNMPKDDM